MGTFHRIYWFDRRRFSSTDSFLFINASFIQRTCFLQCTDFNCWSHRSLLHSWIVAAPPAASARLRRQPVAANRHTSQACAWRDMDSWCQGAGLTNGPSVRNHVLGLLGLRGSARELNFFSAAEDFCLLFYFIVILFKLAAEFDNNC